MPPKRFKRKNYKKTKRTKRVPRALGRGSVTIVRKALYQAVTTNASGTTGTARVTDPTGLTGTSMALGTPQLSFASGVFPDVYDIPFAFKFALSEILSYADLTGLADRYMLKNVKIDVHGFNSVQQTNTNYVPNIWIEYTTDYDDSGVPTISAFDERMGNRTKGFNQRGMLTLNVKPRPVIEVGGNATAVAISTKPLWLDSADPDVPHYGIKGVIRNVVLNSTMSCCLRFQPHYTIAGKDFQ